MAQNLMQNIPVALTIAGSDSGGGAGIQADLKTFTANRVFGTTAITCLTAQNPKKVFSIQEIPVQMVEEQIGAILKFFPVRAVKTGMLFSEKIIRRVSEFAKIRNFKLVVDPVMVATSGAKLLQDSAIDCLKKELIPYCDLITPNLDEAEILLGKKITKRSEMEDFAKSLYLAIGVPTLLKGGHLKNSSDAVDVLYDGKEIYTFSKEFLQGVNSHGTGCTYSAAICANLAKGHSLAQAVFRAKEYLHNALKNPFKPDHSSESFLNHFA